jgi:hypothetical protein
MRAQKKTFQINTTQKARYLPYTSEASESIEGTYHHKPHRNQRLILKAPIQSIHRSIASLVGKQREGVFLKLWVRLRLVGRVEKISDMSLVVASRLALTPGWPLRLRSYIVFRLPDIKAMEEIDVRPRRTSVLCDLHLLLHFFCLRRTRPNNNCMRAIPSTLLM